MAVGNNSKWVNTELKGELVQEFELVKRYYGIGSNADVVRFLIRKEIRQIQLMALPGEGVVEEAV